MPRDLFGDVTRPTISVGNRKRYTVPVSLLTHSAVVAALIALPLLAPAMLPAVLADDNPRWVTTVLPPPPPPPRLRPAEAQPIADPDAAPTEAPDSIEPEKPVDLDTSFQDSTTPGLVAGTDNIDSVIVPPPQIIAAPPQPVRVGGSIRQPQKVRNVDPVYPQLAILSRIEGVVIIEATIGPDGKLMDARVLRGHQMLDQAALVAVRQWEFTPTLLNGVPVPVIMTVTVRFTLSK